MALVDGSISSLIQGVSQQPERERLPGQCTVQENYSSDPVNGLQRRGPLEHVKSLISDANTYKFDYYNAGSLGKFIIANRAGVIRVFGLDGTEYTVNIDADAAAYLTDQQMLFIGLDNIIYVADPTKTVQVLSGGKPYADKSAIAFLLGGQYGRTYKIKLKFTVSGVENNIEASYLTPDGSAASHINNIATNFIATKLETNLNALGAIFTDNFTVTREDDVLSVERTDSSEFTLSVEDGDGGVNFIAVNNSVGDIGDLPRYAPQGYYVKVDESGSATIDDWYLEFVAEDDTIAIGDGFGTEGVWVETVAPGLDYQFDTATMPHQLVKDEFDVFTFKRGAWEDRRVGDDDTNPLPSFVGNTINDLQTFQGRLAITSDVNIVMSRTNAHTDFFKESATALIDSDPIDISSSIGTFILRDMVPHNRDLVIFSDAAQFIVFGRNAITPQNTSLVLTTEFDADLSAKPTAAGRAVFFGYKYGNFTGIQEFFTDGATDINDARNITQNVLQYIKGKPTQLISTTNFNKLIVRSDADKSRIYVYEYIWVQNQKAQSAWSSWKFSSNVEHCFFVDNLLYAVVSDGTDYRLTVLDLDVTADNGLDFRIELDNKIEAKTVNTAFDVPYTVDDIDTYVAVQGTGCPNPGLRVLIDSIVGNTVTLQKDMGGGNVFFGKRYKSIYQPTQPFVRDRDGVAIGSGHLIVKEYTVYFEDTGYLEALITDEYGYYSSVEYKGRVIGSPDNLIGKPAISDGRFKIPYKKNTTNSNLVIQSDDYTPMSLLELEWKGQYRKKGRRITGG